VTSFEGRRRVVIEEIKPVVDGGRFPAKRIVGDDIGVSAAIFSDGHDHVGARLLYKPEEEKLWNSVPMHPVTNDIWTAQFTPDRIGVWLFRVEGWVDHFDTWSDQLNKRLLAQHRPATPPAGPETGKEIPLALLTGAKLLQEMALEIKGSDGDQMKAVASQFRQLAEEQRDYYDNPVTDAIKALVACNPDLRFASASDDFQILVDRERARFSSWYEFFPRSLAPRGQHGTLTDAAELIPSIANAGFNVIYLPPIHPIGRAYRKGKNNNVEAGPEDVGSPWAIGNEDGGHTAIAPELGGFDDFEQMMKVALQNGVEIALDIAFQCSPDHPWVKSHPEWFSIRPDGSIQYAENPPKKYQDIYPLNFESSDWRALWEELFNVFAFWIQRGVKIFRVDNPHTKAFPFWEWCISRIKRLHPEVIFLSEAFTRPHVMYGLAKRGFTQSYTYFTWRTTKQELEEYMTELISEPVCEFFRPNFWPNTPDILPAILQTGLRAAFVQRVVLAATLSSNYGVYGPAYELLESERLREKSEEYANSEKYEIRTWDRDHERSLMPLLKTLNDARAAHAGLQRNDTLHFHPTDNPELICYSKTSGSNVILVVVNLDVNNTQSGWTDLHLSQIGLAEDRPYLCRDLLDFSTYVWNGSRNFIRLDPAVMPAHVFHIDGSNHLENEAHV
jgi:starch synthase (maltosyl-transferring)